MNEELQNLQALLASPEGQALRAYLASELMSLRFIENVKDFEHPYAQAVEIRAQKKAYEKLAAILARLDVVLADSLTRDPRDSFSM
jgi:hypothetical protein